MLLTGGPFDGHEAAFVPPDTGAPVQVVWSGWFPWGFAAYLYEWHGERATDRGRTDALVFRPVARQVGDRTYVGRLVPAAEIPPRIAEDVELWAGANAGLVEALDLPPEAVWPGL
jgi:hypothetical protein